MQCACHVHMHMHTYALCAYTRHLRTCQYVAILVNQPNGISQAAAIAANRTQGVLKVGLAHVLPHFNFMWLNIQSEVVYG